MNSLHEQFAVMAEQYVAGNISPEDLAAFEEHYYECPECLRLVRRLQVVQRGLMARPSESFALFSGKCSDFEPRMPSSSFRHRSMVCR